MQKFREFMTRFMRGRYGVDILGRDLSFISLAVLLLGIILNNGILNIIVFLTMVFMYFRTFSKNFSRRYNENRIYLNTKAKITKPIKKFFKRLKDFPKYKYLKCPQCHKQLRVPRGKKDITVTCPSCHHKFDART